MLSNWIFIIKDTESEFKKRIEDKRWPIYKFTKHKRQLRKGDNVIFYMAGSGGKKFLGMGELASELKDSGSMDSIVMLSNTKTWKDPVPMNNVLEHLKFITNKVNWGIHFQGGVIKISDDDYNLILSKKSKLTS